MKSESSDEYDRRGVVAVVAREGRFLVIRRSRHVVAPLAYCFPGGGIEAAESETAALVREVHEELALRLQPIRRLWESVTPWNVHLAWWQAEIDVQATPVPNSSEVESVHWLTPTEMAGLPGLLESNLAFLDALNRGQIELRG